MGCNATVDTFQSITGELDVQDKYKKLMETTLGDGSLYMRTKETISVLFEDLDVPAQDKAKMSIDYIAQMSTALSATAMQTALEWAKEEKSTGYSLALIKAQTEKMFVDKEVSRESICKIQKETESICATIEATIAGSIRDNGNVTQYDTNNPCKPISLDNTGLKHEQTQQVKAATYQSFADAYRKSGVVEIGVDIKDQTNKGLSGDEDGYTWQQQKNAERQRIAYEDSKISHAANSSASMIGQMLTAEIAPNEVDVQRWRDAVDRLIQKHSTTSST